MKRQFTCMLLASIAMPAFLHGQSQETLASPAPEATQFDFLVGDWTYTAVWKTPNGERRGVGTWTARKAFDGFGVVDEWRILDAPGGNTTYLGTSARVYSPAKGHWDMRFLNVRNATWHEQFAESRDGEMFLWWTGEDLRGQFRMRVRYYDIDENSFRWRADRSYDDGATWIENWLMMEVTRITDKQ